MRRIFRLVVLLSGIVLLMSAQTATKKATTRAATTPVQSTARKTGPAAASATKTGTTRAATTKTGTTKTVATKTAATRKGSVATKRRTVAAPQRQQTPSADRYREIQQALIDKGYLKSEATGQWDDQSTEALRQFQTDKKLTATGKITAMSLIDLGLGPKPADAPASGSAPATESSPASETPQ